MLLFILRFYDADKKDDDCRYYDSFDDCDSFHTSRLGYKFKRTLGIKLAGAFFPLALHDPADGGQFGAIAADDGAMPFAPLLLLNAISEFHG